MDNFLHLAPLCLTADVLQLWIHSFNGSEVEAYLDDIEIVKEAG